MSRMKDILKHARGKNTRSTADKHFLFTLLYQQILYTESASNFGTVHKLNKLYDKINKSSIDQLKILDIALILIISYFGYNE